ncbi:MAG: hypothetical protein QM730_13935 [Anaerolineales bacterium]
MDKQHPHRPHHPPVPLRVGLVILLIISSMGVWDAIAWTYHRVDQGLGHEIAEVIVAFLVIVIFG